MEFSLYDLGLVDYKYSWQLQHDLFNKVKDGSLQGALVICQHNPVITLGRLADKNNILVKDNELSKMGVPVYQIERGGDVTYHGPGQIIAYPIFNLQCFKKDIHCYLRKLEDVIIGMLYEFGVAGSRYKGYTGVWIKPFATELSEQGINEHSLSKIASIGIAIKNWITFHGLSINIKKFDLARYSFIRPCGMNIKITCLENITKQDVEMDLIKKILVRKFKRIFNIKALCSN